MKRVISGLTYTLTYKDVKRINLRVTPDGIKVSVHPRVPPAQIDAYILSKKDWILKALSTLSNRTPAQPALPFDSAECLAFFEKMSDLIFLYFAGFLKEKPRLQIKHMKSRWGVCHVQKRTITLNAALRLKPFAAVEYVMLHEYVHFLHPDHQKGFHDTMKRLMPDYKQRRSLLK